MHGIPAMPRYDSAGTRVPRNTIPDRASISEGLWRPTACSDCLLRHLQRFEFLPRKPSILENTEIPRARFHAVVTEPGKSFASRNSSFLPRLGSSASDRVIGESLSRIESFNGGIRLLRYVGTDLRNACAKQPELACPIQRKHSRRASQTTILDAVNRD